MISLFESETFKKEYRRYREEIDTIPVEEVREKAKSLLAKLVSEIKFLDSQHQDLFSTHKVPMRLDETKKKIGSLRKDLERFLNDAKNTK
jgi:hypothetical protein